jgi:NADPH-dependent 2,4-dienoyl-CoA reductase/sulfur reductase-like enzyme
MNRLTKNCNNSKNIVIIGNGVSGITCARNIRKGCSAPIIVISAETDYHYSRTALMYVYMGHMRFEDTKPYEDGFWKKNRIKLVNKFVTRIDSAQKQVYFSTGEILPYDILILASGSKPNKFGWPGQDLIGVQGLFSYQDLLLMEENTKHAKHAVLVGGGLIGVEMAEMLHSRKISVTFLVREKNFWDNVLPLEEAKLIEKHFEEHHVDLRLETELKEIVSDENGRAKAIVTTKGDLIPCDFVGLTVGVSPNIDFIKNSEINTDRGILVNEYFETNIKDVYAIGDCAQFIKPPNGRRAIEQVWYTGRMHGETLAHAIVICEKVAYNPGHWFNSAKFFDIEYQTYGNVPSKFPENLNSFYWQHPTEKICLRLAFERASEKFIGLNVFGIRIRHAVIDKWLNEKRSLEYVLENLSEANFDPEFFTKYEKLIQNSYAQSNLINS